MEACCTCAQLLSTVPVYSEKSEKLLPQDRQLECCGRVICGDCLHKNPRFSTYCPYCQISSSSSLLPQGLKEPPSYTSATSSAPTPTPTATTDSPSPYTQQPPPSYTPTSSSSSSSEKPSHPPSEPILHFLNHTTDTLPSLSLSYSVPIATLRALNRLSSDHLLAARRTILIPPSPNNPSHSLSPVPVEGEEESARKNKIRRWMVATKVADYDVAVLYLEQSGYALEEAVERFRADERWEREHPLHDAGRKKGKGTVRVGGLWAGQAAFLRRGG